MNSLKKKNVKIKEVKRKSKMNKKKERVIGRIIMNKGIKSISKSK